MAKECNLMGWTTMPNPVIALIEQGHFMKTTSKNEEGATCRKCLVVWPCQPILDARVMNALARMGTRNGATS